MDDQTAEDRAEDEGRRPCNQLLASLTKEELDRLWPDLELVHLEPKQVLSNAGEHPDYAYFPEGGILSFTLELPESGPVEFGIVGRDGVSSLSALRWERRSPVRIVVQIGGYPAYRIRSERLRAALKRDGGLDFQIQEFLYNFMGQMAFTAVSNARHSLSARLARWLLLCNDRLDTDEVPLTHEFMAMMLGAQRTSVTSVLHIIEGEGAIRSRRGVVHLVDRAALERFAGEAYFDPAGLWPGGT